MTTAGAGPVTNNMFPDTEPLFSEPQRDFDPRYIC